MLLAKSEEGIHSSIARHQEIREDEIDLGVLLFNECEGMSPALRLDDAISGVRERDGVRLPHILLVLDDQDGWDAGLGVLVLIVAPAFGSEASRRGSITRAVAAPWRWTARDLALRCRGSLLARQHVRHRGLCSLERHVPARNAPASAKTLRGPVARDCANLAPNVKT
jgi:hypothetical protein